MGEKVLKTEASGNNELRAYSHCSKNSGEISLVLMNLSSEESIEVEV